MSLVFGEDSDTWREFRSNKKFLSGGRGVFTDKLVGNQDLSGGRGIFTDKLVGNHSGGFKPPSGLDNQAVPGRLDVVRKVAAEGGAAAVRKRVVAEFPIDWEAVR